jgi:uncharacterized protein
VVDPDPSRASLVEAAYHGYSARVSELLASGNLDIDQPDEDGCTSLHLAIGEGFSDIAKLLLSAGADVSAVDGSGFTTLHWAVLSGDPHLLELSYAPAVGIDPLDHEGRTPLSWTMAGDEALGCSEGAALTCLEWLLARGASVSEADYDGWTPLHHAAARGNLAALRRLLESGADPSVLSQARESPAGVAARLGQAEAAGLLQGFEKSP